MKFKLIEEILQEKTTLEYELGKHLLADIANTSHENLRGLRATVIKQYGDSIYDLCRKITTSTEEANTLFSDIKDGDWTVHHINGIHKDNKIGDVNNLALVKSTIHTQVNEQNYKFISDVVEKKIPSYIPRLQLTGRDSSDLDKLIYRLIVILAVNDIKFEEIFSFELDENIRDFLISTIPQKISENFYNKYPYSTKDVILLRDISIDK